MSRRKKRAQLEAEKEVLPSMVPEIWNTPGLTDNMRSEFGLMKDQTSLLIVTPNQRHLH